MSAKIMGQVYDLDLSSREQSVLLAMADHADHEGGNIFPRVGLIAWKIKCSPRTVQRAMRCLEQKGILERVRERPGRTTIYKINIKAGKLKARYREGTADNLSPLTNCHQRQSSGAGAVTESCQGRSDTVMSPITVREPEKKRLANRLNDYPGSTQPKRVCESESEIQKKTEREGRLMSKARDLIGRETMDRDGGFVRTLIREDPERAEKVLADLENALKEGRTVRNRFGYFIDTWKRFGKRVLESPGEPENTSGQGRGGERGEVMSQCKSL